MDSKTDAEYDRSCDDLVGRGVSTQDRSNVMRRYGYAIAIFVGMICAAHTACAQSPWYITGSAGAYLRSDASRSTTFFNDSRTITVPGTATTTYDPGPVVNLGVGYRLPLGFRIEGELGYAHYSVDSVSPLSTGGAPTVTNPNALGTSPVRFPSRDPFVGLNGNRLALQSGGGHDTYTGTINAFYDLPIPGWIVPYVGAGFGVAHGTQQTAHFSGPDEPRFTGLGSSATNAVILAELGVTFRIDDRWSVMPSYRFEHVFTTGNAFPSNANIFKLGVRYSF
jgi:opacity protein-like surface antigen